MSFAAKALKRIKKAAANTSLLHRALLRSLFHVVGDVGHVVDHLEYGLEDLVQGLVTVNDLTAPLALRVTGADIVAGAPVSGQAAAARGVSVTLASPVAKVVAAKCASHGVVTEGGGHGGVGDGNG